jgi:hypothetical protein
MGWARPQARVRPFRPPKRTKVVLPTAVFEVQSGFIMAAQLSRTRHKVSRLAVREFEPEALAAVSCLSNVSKPEELRETLRAVDAALGNGKGPFGLLIPDPVVRVSILEFETLPADAKDQESLIQWKMKPLLPFPSEEARLSFEVSHQEPGRIEVMALAARNSVLAEYETILEALGSEIKLVLPSTGALLPLLDEKAEQGELLLHVWPGGLTAVVVGGGRLRLWRSQSVRWTSPEECLAAVSQETSRMLASAQDHLLLEIGRICLCVRPPVPEEWIQELGRAISREVYVLMADSACAGSLSADEAELLRYFGAPLAGLLANAV